MSTLNVKKFNNSSSSRFTKCAIHPEDDFVATGDTKGEIKKWFVLGKNEKVSKSDEQVVTSSMHWHAHSVCSLKFTFNGAYLLSGGEESVLVMWQLATGHQQFLPRLGGPFVESP